MLSYAVKTDRRYPYLPNGVKLLANILFFNETNYLII